MVAKNMPFDMAFKIKAPANPRNAANDRSGVIRDGGEPPQIAPCRAAFGG